jgi:hypothetical protein
MTPKENNQAKRGDASFPGLRVWSSPVMGEGGPFALAFSDPMKQVKPHLAMWRLSPTELVHCLRQDNGIGGLNLHQ